MATANTTRLFYKEQSGKWAGKMREKSDGDGFWSHHRDLIYIYSFQEKDLFGKKMDLTVLGIWP